MLPPLRLLRFVFGLCPFSLSVSFVVGHVLQCIRCTLCNLVGKLSKSYSKRERSWHEVDRG
jgi:hypothetical protein